ncbi:glycosyltransferase family 4 protein [Marinobacter shengliensis]|uniref:glycosyltransferase family 4 protein n=1 Tax=Marinobacter shengliensis TaxID=1389223 RepID=UPI001E33F42C|nr:glycosyltransferase family 4 protein [Marinobacter shengliensis]MCD1631304.1 glycosyltransferase family 4 protein [Marinobacter shengliensis]
MRVVVFARHPSGGIRTYFSYVYGDKAQSDNTFSLVTPESESLQALVEPLSNVEIADQSTESLAMLLIALLKQVMKARPGLVHSHGFTAGLVAALPLWLFRIPHVITTHDVFMPGQFQGLLGKLKKRIMASLFSLADVINPVGEDAASNFIDTFPDLGSRGRVKGIRNGIKAESFLVDSVRDLRNEAGIPSDALVLGFFGRFMAQKGFGLLVDAVERLNQEGIGKPVHVCCFGWGGFIREEQADIRSRGMESFFHFFPATDLMAEAIRGVDVVVMPSRWEACPLLPMEVMVSGRPLIASNCIGMKEVVADSPAIIFDAGSLDGLLEKIRLFGANQNAFQLDSDRFRQEAALRFDVSQTSSKLMRLFNDVLTKPESCR